MKLFKQSGSKSLIPPSESQVAAIGSISYGSLTR